MSITKTSDTEWEVVFACSNYNGSFEVEVTAEGISVNDNLIHWAEINAAWDAARLATQRAPRTHEGLKPSMFSAPWSNENDLYTHDHRLVSLCPDEDQIRKDRQAMDGGPVESDNKRLREVLKEALDQTGCDGDLCNYRWHEKARVLLGEGEDEIKSSNFQHE